jgi:preprotein translocase subunit SecE
VAEAEKKTKRRVKNPETFRERASKAADTPSKPSWFSRVKSGLGSVLSRVFSPIGSFLHFVFYRQPFLILRKPLRIIGHILLPKYIRNSWRELKQVTWPTFRQSRQLTIAVILFAAVFGALIAVVDYGLDKLFRHLLLK